LGFILKECSAGDFIKTEHNFSIKRMTCYPAARNDKKWIYDRHERGRHGLTPIWITLVVVFLLMNQALILMYDCVFLFSA
jgi:hypothetical protein